MAPNQTRKSSWKAITVLSFLGVLGWGLTTGRILIVRPSFASYTVPAGAATVDVHPDVLNLQTSFSKVAEMVKPAVVNISTVRIERVTAQGPEFFFGDPFEDFYDQFFGGRSPMGEKPRTAPRKPREFRSEGVGSGVIIDPAGLILTNEHVVRSADQIKVTLYGKNGEKKELDGRVVGKDARTDLAVVRVKAGYKLPFAALGDSDKIKVGDWAIAIGSPFGLAQTVTVGIISADRQSLVIEGKEFHNMIQTDAAINRGNSGGPLLNIRGEVIAINTAIFAPTGVFAGIGFAVPVNQAKAILDDLIQKGHVERGWLGVELAREITPAFIKAFGLKDTKGALVNDIVKNSPAEKAGLKRGDVIRGVDGNPVESADQLQNLVSRTKPKKSIKLEVVREKQPLKLTLVVGQRPESVDTGEEEGPNKRPSEQKTAEKEWLGARLVEFTPDLAATFRQPREARGVAVMDVEPTSQAEDMGLMVGDLIRAVNQKPTPDLATFKKATTGLSLEEGVVLDILRQGRALYLGYSAGK